MANINETENDRQILIFKWNAGIKQIFPAHKFVNNWLFDETTEDEACLAHFIAKVAEKSGLTRNDLQHLFPYVLRILKNESTWSK